MESMQLQQAAAEQAVYRGYLEAALFTGEHGNPPEMGCGTCEKMLRDCAQFLRENVELLNHTGMDLSHIGHNFWLSRNGHGTGFWDRGLGDLGDALSEAAREMGTQDLYSGDDERLYVA